MLARQVTAELVTAGEADVLVDSEDEEPVQVTLAYRGQEEVLIRSGLEPGQRVVTAGLAQPREGQEVRIRQRGDTPAQDEGAAQ